LQISDCLAPLSEPILGESSPDATEEIPEIIEALRHIALANSEVIELMMADASIHHEMSRR
jgi:hypothetical protein